MLSNTFCISSTSLLQFCSEEQKELIHKTIGHNRLVYNRMLRKKIKYYEKNCKSLSKINIDKRITKLKHNEKFDFLNEVDSASFQCTSENLHQAYQRFFNGQNQFPKYHSKHSSHQSYTTKFILRNIKVFLMKTLFNFQS